MNSNQNYYQYPNNFQNSYLPSSNFQQSFQSNQRVSEIQQIYLRILGRMPSTEDVNFITNSRMTDLDLIMKMINSLEHQEIIKSRALVIGIQAEIISVKQINQNLEVKNKDLEAMNQTFKKLLEEKTKSIDALAHDLSREKQLNNEISRQNKILQAFYTKYKKRGLISRILN